MFSLDGSPGTRQSHGRASRPALERAEHSRWAFVHIPRMMPVSLAAGALCIALAGLTSEWGPLDLRSAALFAMGADRGASVLKGEVWRLASSVFLHADARHLANNVLALLLFGSLVETTLGSRRFCVLFAAAGLISSSVQGAIRPDAVTCGASGALWGLMTAALRIDTSHVRASFGMPPFAVSPRLIPPATQRLLGTLALVLVGISLNLHPNAAVAAHLTGGCVGVLLVPALQRWDAVRSERGVAPRLQRSWLTFAAWATTLSMLAGVLVGVARGRAWELLDPPIERIQLGSTGLSIDLPSIAARDPTDGADGEYEFGFAAHSPMRWVLTTRELMIPASDQDMFRAGVIAGKNAPLGADWIQTTPAISVDLGGRAAIRSVARLKARKLEEVTHQMFVGPYWIRLTAWRDGPSVWPGLEDRSAASLGIHRLH
jgi:membrane associated rhomboid family serine protease